jgi:cytochrome c-type biogenesis protein CcmE
MTYIVRSRTTGGRYLTVRETGSKFYRWTKRSKKEALHFESYDAAQKASIRYNGILVSIK